MEAALILNSEGRRVRVVNLSCWEAFERQPKEYREQVLPSSISRRLAVEAGIAQGWERYLGPCGQAISIEGYGHSAPWKTIAERLGYTADHVLEKARELLA